MVTREDRSPCAWCRWHCSRWVMSKKGHPKTLRRHIYPLEIRHKPTEVDEVDTELSEPDQPTPTTVETAETPAVSGPPTRSAAAKARDRILGYATSDWCTVLNFSPFNWGSVWNCIIYLTRHSWLFTMYLIIHDFNIMLIELCGCKFVIRMRELIGPS